LCSHWSHAGDFDGDGYADLAIGVEWEDLGGATNAGVVNVLYGTFYSIKSTGDQLFDQDYLATDASESGDLFGQVLAVGDFDGDGVFDLAVGVPGEDVGSESDAGAVHVVYGIGGNGLSTSGNQFWHQDSAGIGGGAEGDDRFGAALAVGDFDGDGFDDLAVGVPQEDLGSGGTSAGAVNVIYGSESGLSAVGDQVWYEGYNDLGGAPEAGDWFGQALSTGDFDNDGYDDLAISIPGEDLGDAVSAGRVVVLYGTSAGLSGTDSQAWVQGLFGVPDSYEDYDYFGESLVAGDFDGDGYDDLGIGVPSEDTIERDTGMVVVLYGSSGGLTAGDAESWTVSVNPGRDDGYGWSLCSGDFDGDGFDDMAVGIPWRDYYGTGNVGAVAILSGTVDGLDPTKGWNQGSIGAVDSPETGDHFGMSLASGDFNGDGYDDLAVGVPDEDVEDVVDAGAVHLFRGSSTGLTSYQNKLWHQDVDGVEDSAETADHFGGAVAAIPGTKMIFYDGFESGGISRWSSSEGGS
jgi:hypothetical protein